MDCASITAALRAGQVPAGPEVDAHVADCPPCASLVSWESVPEPLSADGGAPSFGELQAALAQEKGIGARLRELPTAARRLATFATVVVTAVLVFLITPRGDLGVYPGMRFGIELVLLAIVVAAAALEALRPLHRAPQARPNVYLGVILAGIIVPIILAALPTAHTDSVLSLAGTGDDFGSRARACFGFGTVVGIPTLGVIWLAGRVRPPSPRVAFMVALAAGLTGDLALQLHCPITLSRHLLAGHATVPLAMIVALGLWARAASRR